METLYRKYRPQNWKSLTGQDHITLTLQKQISTDKTAHAYLFTGPRGSGKTSTARILAKTLNCQNRQANTTEPCNECSSCQEITAGRSLDVVEIDAASNTGVDNVRENIIDSARLSPTKSKFKIFIIDEVHMLSASAFNALLKIIEEPPKHVFFILATTEAFKIPGTVLSRCQRFDFKKVEVSKIKERLKMICEKEGVEAEVKILDRIAHQSDGCLRDAEGLLGQILALGEKKVTDKEASLVLPRSDWHKIIELLDFLVTKNARESIMLINNLVEDGIDLYNFTEDLIRALRLLLLTKLNVDLNLLNDELEEEGAKKIRSLSLKIEAGQIGKMIEIFIKQKTLLRSTHIPQLPLEVAVVTICENNTVTKEDSEKKSSTGNTIATETKPATKKEEPQAKEVKIIIENTTKEPVVDQSFTLEQVKEQWDVFLKKVQEYNHSLPFILKMGEPVELRGRIVKIAFRYTFHRDKINESKVRAMAEKALNEVFKGANLGLEGIHIPIEESVAVIDKPAEKVDNELVTNLIESFGGQLAE
ncbi:MAG: DNA polymerase III subunit gamma/tau [Candidatus Magasanikbacteria bacterium]|nr:DNA polymerase III subunit gamma/tau [Candidatus Magasanikbacteria bacterium]